MRNLLVLACFFLYCICIKAQNWTLEQCIDYALKNNLSIKQQKLNFQLKEINLNTAKMSLLPDVSARVNQSFGLGRALTSSNTYDLRNTANTSVDVGANVTLFQGGYKRNNIVANKIMLNAAEQDLQKATDELCINIASYYLQVLYAEEVVQLNQKQLQLSISLHESIVHQFELGKRAEVDVVKSIATIAQDSLSLVNSQNEYQLALLDLAQLIDVDPENFTIVAPNGEIEFRMVMSPDNAYQTAMIDRAEIRAAELRVENAEKQISIAKSSLYPTLNLSVGLGSNYYKSEGLSAPSFGKQMKNNMSESINITLNIPVFSRFSTRNSVRSAKIQREQSEVELELQKQHLRKQIEQAYYNVVAAETKYRSSNTAALSSKTAFNLIKSKYNLEMASKIELDEARIDWIRNITNMIEAKYEYIFKLKILYFYVGEKITQ